MNTANILTLVIFLIGFILLSYRIRLWTGGKLSLPAIPSLGINQSWILSASIVALIASVMIGVRLKLSSENFTHHQQQSPTSGLAPSCDRPLPFQRTSGYVKKISQTEAEVRMNGGEGMLDSGLTLRPNQSLKIEQIIFSDPKKNRLTYNWCGDCFPVWGGGTPAPTQRLRYPLPGSGNGVIVVLQNENYESPVPFPANKTSMEIWGPGRVCLYYNTVIEWTDINGARQQNDGGQAGWDGSTATFRLTISQR